MKSELALGYLLLQLIVIFAFAQTFGFIAKKFRQPRVVGEICAGLLLGPSFLGRLFPDLSARLFSPEAAGLAPAGLDALLGFSHHLFAQIGLILLLFLIGLEFDFCHLKTGLRNAFWISLAGIIAPFTLGVAIAPLLYQASDCQAPLISFSLFLATALSITAIPILGRMMVEFGIHRLRLATMTISAAAIDDAFGWILLATVTAGVTTGFNLAATAQMIGQSGLFALVMIYFIGPKLRQIASHWIDEKGELSQGSLSLILLAIFGSAIITNRIGIFAIFGAFLLGAVLSPEPRLARALKAKLNDFVSVFFLPLFFTYTGLRTDLGTLETPYLGLLALLLLATAILGKWLGCGLAAYFTGFRLRQAACIGVMMNTRALMELIVINVGFELGIIPQSIYTMLVMMAIITTLMTTPLLLKLARKTELEEPMIQAGFLTRH